ncbi:cytochrome P450 [Phlegmacium glaucopus]|nr:cytochrome P450 [Phlegmacium glaucopus]
MPIDKPWLVYEEWCKTYGDMVYFNVLGQHFLVLGSKERTTDLFEKRSSNYSDRLRSPMLVDLMKSDFNMAFLPYGLNWRKHRKSFHKYFHLDVVSKYLPIQKREVHAFLRRLLITPDNFRHHIRQTFATTIMSIAYGIEVKESDDPYVSLAEEALNGINQAAIPGAFWVDLFPILKYVPSWFPGAGFQKKAAYWRGVNATMIETPFRYVKEQLKSGKAAPSVAASLIECLPDEDDPQRLIEESLAQDVAAVAYLGGADTTVSTVQTLFLAMALYPEVQRKAQAELDAVVGPNRLPDFEDRPSLPYINAIVKESMRWNLVLPLAIAHVATNDDEYNGYYIPKGTVVMGNSWSILHDPEVFNDPMEYRPERYLKDGKLNPDVLDPSSVAFGYGRRICPGRHLSDNSLYSIVSCLLAVYDIKPPVDDHGNIIKLEPKFTSGLLSYPVPFKCIISPRSAAAEALIKDSVNEDS